ncbi:MAG: hypothetical protein EOS57_18220 [Mesorhizobium sp.]|nr:hypothetical protein [Mesorhizobium sp.]TGU00036.1 hypothetical protein EN807_09195 [Mesorhizobium sp. M5C.F.Ca.ET.164.01.1.1]RWB28712.1 MAG: hypothetical protein EOQ43_22355 [Mesorhizobium sp.]RWC07644.1 MAG: hypothetical protein EOS51_27165 [Mesorhizobium sp.]RWC28705.1 MAG: hypothetical protein EOS70_26350 [Mesorhizobium sp.]RWD17316.1 MAG: hypothetical protein EOS57_18220 [Mesorhizobium sp.]
MVFIGGFFAMAITVALNKWVNEASPIRSVDAVDATIKTVYWGKGYGRTYALFLDNGSLILVEDEQPHLIGSNARLERVTRNNGSVSYRFAH